MKVILLVAGILFGNLGFASEPPSDYPVVKGVIRKIDLASGRISIKHEYIPNLDMPGMTMSFVMQDPQRLQDFTAGDKILFVSDDIEGELTVLWIEKAPVPNVNTANILCTGIGNTTPKTSVELEVRRGKSSTVRYEHIEGAYPGTAHINSIGNLTLHKRGDFFIYRRGEGVSATRLIFKVNGDQITDATLSFYNAGMQYSSVSCSFL